MEHFLDLYSNIGFHMFQMIYLFIELQSGDKVASLTQWSEWTRCSRSCGSGRRSRSRKCGTKDLDEYEVIDCQGSLLELEDCNSQACPIVLDM